jgi:hypothetical protein
MTKDEQRRRKSTRMMVSTGLEAHLRNLATTGLGDDPTAAVTAAREFQECVQYAPLEMKSRLLAFLEERAPEKVLKKTEA